MITSHPLRLALYQPDIPQNTAAAMRICACLGVPAEIIGPTGFAIGGAKARRVGMDYLSHVMLNEHEDWIDFQKQYTGSRRILLTTKVDKAFTSFEFLFGDILLFGSESAGAPKTVHADVDFRLSIPMVPGMRSLNLATSIAMVLGEALRQLDAFPGKD